MGAVIGGVRELKDMMTYFENTMDFYREKFNILLIPSRSTFSRVLNIINADKVGTVITEIMCKYTDVIGDILAVDGKTIRGTGEKDVPHSLLQILSVYATESGITLLQKPIEFEDKTNEIPVFREMLDDLNIEKKIITADALHCQKETCKKIDGKKGHYVFGVKENQATLLEEISFFLDDPVNQKEMDTFETIEKNGGRIEQRICHVSDDVSWITGVNEWAGLSRIFSVKRIITYKGKTTEETGYYITNCDSNAERLLYISRSHWKIESMHWALDVIWNEDNNDMKSDNTQLVLNAFRKVAHYAHKKHVTLQPEKKRRSVKQNVFQCLLNHKTCFEVMSMLMT
jgi:predicted transposase YbfD/YdcC